MISPRNYGPAFWRDIGQAEGAVFHRSLIPLRDFDGFNPSDPNAANILIPTWMMVIERERTDEDI